MATNSERLELRKRRMAESPALLRGGFRPFFLGAAIWAIVALVMWLGTLFSVLPSAVLGDGLAWHRHEMIFGFAGAAVAGFALTAVPNWTGRLPIAGAPLAILFMGWLGGRLVPLLAAIDTPAVILLDGGFYLALSGILSREVFLAGNRNLPVTFVIALFGFADLIDRLEMATLFDAGGMGWRAGVALLVMLIALIGGRIVPSFTRNWLQSLGNSHHLPTQPGKFDRLSIAFTAMALAAWLSGASGYGAAILLVGSGLLNAMRLARWQGFRCLANPLVFILHVGYAWVAIGLALLGAASAGGIVASAGIHALTAGAVGTMILAVMSRASLGHTGRPLAAAKATVLAYACVTVAAAGRVLAALGLGDGPLIIQASGLAWIAAFALFVAVHLPILVSPRADEMGSPR